MFRVRKELDELVVEMHSDLRLIQQIDRPCDEFFGQYGVVPGQDLFLVLRELISNAIHHGNQGDVNRLVRIAINHLVLPSGEKDNNTEHFTVTVQDEGCGFDYLALDLFLPENGGIHAKRGLKLVAALVDQLAFQDTGNGVTVYLHFNPCKGGYDAVNKGPS